MSIAHGPVSILAMSPTRVCTLEVEIDSDPISGRVSDDQGLDLPFSGWLGLAAAIGRLVEVAPPAQAPPEALRSRS